MTRNPVNEHRKRQAKTAAQRQAQTQAIADMVLYVFGLLSLIAAIIGVVQEWAGYRSVTLAIVGLALIDASRSGPIGKVFR